MARGVLVGLSIFPRVLIRSPCLLEAYASFNRCIRCSPYQNDGACMFTDGKCVCFSPPSCSCWHIWQPCSFNADDDLHTSYQCAFLSLSRESAYPLSNALLPTRSMAASRMNLRPLESLSTWRSIVFMVLHQKKRIKVRMTKARPTMQKKAYYQSQTNASEEVKSLKQDLR